MEENIKIRKKFEIGDKVLISGQIIDIAYDIYNMGDYVYKIKFASRVGSKCRWIPATYIRENK